MKELLVDNFLDCGAMGGMPMVERFAAPLKRRGRFADRDRYPVPGGLVGHDSVRGRIGGGTARGVFRNRVAGQVDGTEVTCASGRLKWHARTSSDS